VVANVARQYRGHLPLGSRLDHSHQLTMAARVMAAAKFVASLS
jgi:hypothetical protein